VCDLETSRMGAPYIYDISRLRVNKILYIVSTPTCFDSSASPSGSLNLLLC